MYCCADIVLPTHAIVYFRCAHIVKSLWQEKGLAEERLRMREEQQATDPFEAGGGDEVGGGLKWLSGAGDEDVDEEADY